MATDSDLSAAWSDYYKALEEIRSRVESSPRYRSNPEHRAKAYHVLYEIQALAFNLVIAPRMSNPRLFRALSYQTDIYATGLPGPDFVYAVTLLDGRQVYKMRGRLGQHMCVIQTFAAMWGEAGYKSSGNYDVAKMKMETDGTFEIIIGGPERPDNWIALNPDSEFQPLVVRRQVASWADDIGELSLERISPIDDHHYDHDEFDPTAQVRRIRRASDYIKFLGETYVLGLYEITLASCNGQKNVICEWSEAGRSQTGGIGLAHYIGCIFDIQPDEALLIEMPRPPKAEYWSFQLGDVWGRSLPFHERQVSLNMNEASIDRDGQVRVVLSHRDPGLVNWLDTAGRTEGIILFRVYLAEDPVIPTARKVTFDELSSLLPKDSHRISPAERKAKLDSRRRQVLHVMDG